MAKKKKIRRTGISVENEFNAILRHAGILPPYPKRVVDLNKNTYNISGGIVSLPQSRYSKLHEDYDDK